MERTESNSSTNLEVWHVDLKIPLDSLVSGKHAWDPTSVRKVGEVYSVIRVKNIPVALNPSVDRLVLHDTLTIPLASLVLGKNRDRRLLWTLYELRKRMK